MSMHDPDRVQELRDDIDRRSGEGASRSAEETAQDAKEKHRAAQQAKGFDVVGPQPSRDEDPPLTVWTPPTGHRQDEVSEKIQQMLGQLRETVQQISANPHAFKMVMEAEATREPLFCFRARDFFSIQVLVHYANIVEQYGPDDAQFHNNIVDAIGEFKEWQKLNVDQVRYPD